MKGKSSRHHDREVQLHLYASWALVVLICTLHHATPYMCTTSHYPYYVNYSRHGCPSVRLYIRPCSVFRSRAGGWHCWKRLEQPVATVQAVCLGSKNCVNNSVYSVSVVIGNKNIYIILSQSIRPKSCSRRTSVTNHVGNVF